MKNKFSIGLIFAFSLFTTINPSQIKQSEHYNFETHFTYNNIIKKQNIKNPDDFSSETTKVSMIANYDENTYEVNTAAIRFGTTLEKDSLYFTEAKYGVFIAPSENLKNSFNYYYSSIPEKTLDEFETNLQNEDIKYVVAECSPVSVNSIGATDIDENGKYFQFAGVVRNMETRLVDKLTATCYMEYEGKLYLMQERTFSIASLSEYYLENSETFNFTESQMNFLNRTSKLDDNIQVVAHLENKSKADVCANPGIWAYNAPSGTVNTDTTAIYKDGSIKLSITDASNHSSNFYLRYQPNYEIGKKYEIKMQIKLEGATKFLIGNDYKDSNNYSGSINHGDGLYTITYNGIVDQSEPFMLQIKEITNPQNVSLTILSFEITDVVVERKLENLSNTIVCENPGTWAYSAPSGTVDRDYTAIYSDESIKMIVIDTSNASNTFQLRYQPNYAIGTKYQINMNVKLEGATKFLIGYDYKDSNNYSGSTNHGDGTYTISYNGTVDQSKPFMLQLKEFSNSPTASITIYNFDIIQID